MKIVLFLLVAALVGAQGTGSDRAAPPQELGTARGERAAPQAAASTKSVPSRADDAAPVSAPRPGDGLFWQGADTGIVEGSKAWPDQDPVVEQLVTDLLNEMTPEQRVAQLLMVSWTTEAPTPEILRWIRERNLGGVKIFGWNGENLPVLATAIAEMQRESLNTPLSIPLFTATDQEGGWVRHIKDGTSITPGNMAIGATGLPYDALMSARYIGLELRALGINMNFAPTVDVYVNREAHVIGPRAFSADAYQTGLLGVAYFHGLKETGVMATAKHFPGHGNASGDSHGMLPVIEDDFQTVWERDLVPFRMLVREGIPAVLSGHLSFPEITGTSVPASISTYFKQEILRDRLGFRGIVITDDLYMGGALEYGNRQGWDFAELVKRAIEVGNDQVMLSRTPAFNGTIWNRLMTAYETEPAFAARVDESVRRVLRLKLAYLRPESRVPLEPDPERIRTFMRSVPSREFFLDQAGRSITLVRDEGIPYQPIRRTHSARWKRQRLPPGRTPLFPRCRYFSLSKQRVLLFQRRRPSAFTDGRIPLRYGDLSFKRSKQCGTAGRTAHI